MEDPFMKKCVRDTNYVKTFLHRKSQLSKFTYSTNSTHNVAEKNIQNLSLTTAEKIRNRINPIVYKKDSWTK